MDIRFDPVNHTYTNVYTSEKYVSVTRFLNTFKKKFEADEAASRVAAREGKSVAEVLADWKKISDDAKEYGTKIHGIIEEFNKTGNFDEENTELIKAFKKMGSFKQKDGAEIEKLVYLHQYKIAGTADIIVPNGEYFDIFDIKTNRKFNFYSKYGEYLEAPLDYLPSSEYNIYSLQTSLYAYAYSIMTGRKFRQSAVLYYNKEENDFTFYPTTYLKDQVIAMLNHVKK